MPFSCTFLSSVLVSLLCVFCPLLCMYGYCVCVLFVFLLLSLPPLHIMMSRTVHTCPNGGMLPPWFRGGMDCARLPRFFFARVCLAATEETFSSTRISFSSRSVLGVGCCGLSNTAVYVTEFTQLARKRFRTMATMPPARACLRSAWSGCDTQ